MWAVAAVDWAGLDHQVIVTGSRDRTARVWDPLDSGQSLARLLLLGGGLSILGLNQTTLAFATSRGFLVFEFEGDLGGKWISGQTTSRSALATDSPHTTSFYGQ